jgi:hypothetical protein
MEWHYFKNIRAIPDEWLFFCNKTIIMKIKNQNIVNNSETKNPGFIFRLFLSPTYLFFYINNAISPIIISIILISIIIICSPG